MSYKEFRTELAAIANAVNRCHCPDSKQYKDYGGRGIKVCDEWRADRMAFVEHIGRKPDPALTLDRIDNDKGYEPGNVRWATRREQQLNRRPAINPGGNFNGLRITIDGVTLTQREWSKRSGVSEEMIKKRRKQGLEGPALLAPVSRYRFPKGNYLGHPPTK